MRRSLAAVPLLLAVLAAGCTGGASSSSDFQGEEKQVAEVVEDLQSAGETGDARAICEDVLATSLSDEIKAAGSTCEQEMDKAITDADDFELDVEDVTIQGDTATVKVRASDGGEDRVRTFEFQREGSSWRATDLGA